MVELESLTKTPLYLTEPRPVKKDGHEILSWLELEGFPGRGTQLLLVQAKMRNDSVVSLRRHAVAWVIHHAPGLTILRELTTYQSSRPSYLNLFSERYRPTFCKTLNLSFLMSDGDSGVTETEDGLVWEPGGNYNGQNLKRLFISPVRVGGEQLTDVYPERLEELNYRSIERHKSTLFYMEVEHWGVKKSIVNVEPTPAKPYRSMYQEWRGHLERLKSDNLWKVMETKLRIRFETDEPLLNAVVGL